MATGLGRIRETSEQAPESARRDAPAALRDEIP